MKNNNIMKVYKIECEWDLGIDELFSTKEKALQEINEINLSSLGLDSEDIVLNETIWIEEIN